MMGSEDQPHSSAAGQVGRSRWERWRAVFAIDLRALAAFRIALAATMVLDAFCRLSDVGAFLSDEGILPRVVRIEMIPLHHPQGLDGAWSLHLFSGLWWAQALLLLIAAVSALCLLIGYGSQRAALACWILQLSVENRNPLLHDAGDAVQRSLLIWAIFLPLGARWSIDAWRQRHLRLRQNNHTASSPVESPVIVSWASAAILLQLATIYFSAALYKLHPVWTRELSGVYYALNCDAFATRWGLFVRQFPRLMQVLTAGTMMLEALGPLALLCPWGNRWIRLVVAPLFILFHLGLVITMTLGLFPWICIAGWLLFLPAEFWDAVVRWLGSVTSPSGAHLRGWPERITRVGRRGLARLLAISSWSRAEVPAVRRSWIRESIVVVLLFYAVFWNLIEVLDDSTRSQWIPSWCYRPAVALGLEKGWSMFAPVPSRDDGWPIFRGTLHDGTEVNLWEPGRPLPWDKPAVVSDLYHSQRWRRCIENLMDESQAWQRPYFADWLQYRWNEQYSAGQAKRRVAMVEMLRRLEPTPPPGEPFLPWETVTLWTKWYP